MDEIGFPTPNNTWENNHGSGQPLQRDMAEAIVHFHDCWREGSNGW